jgi:hypothetical protein
MLIQVYFRQSFHPPSNLFSVKDAVPSPIIVSLQTVGYLTMLSVMRLYRARFKSCCMIKLQALLSHLS